MKTLSKKTPDGFSSSPANPYATQHQRLNEYLRDPRGSALAATSGKLEKPEQVALLCAALERIEFQKKQGKPNSALKELVKKVASRKLTFEPDHLEWNLKYAATILAPKDPDHVQWEELDSPIPGVVPPLLDEVETLQRAKPLGKGILDELNRLHASIKPMEYYGGYKKTLHRIAALVAQKAAGMPDDGEAWAEAIRQDIQRMPPKKREQWLALLQNVPKGTSATPTAKWKKEADALLAAVGHEAFAKQIEQWFALVGLKATQRIQPRNAALLRSLVWYASLLKGETVCRALANAVEGGLRKFTGGSLYASSISKACITALEAMPGLEPLAQLSRLKRRVKSPWGLEEIERALTAAVARSGASLAEVEEISLPTFDLDSSGALRRKIGDFAAELSIVGTREVATRWFDSKGKEIPEKPSIPKKFAAEDKSLKQLARDLEKMLAAQKDRVEDFLERDRKWTFPVWKARYLEHPLMTNLSRRLIWQFTEGKRLASAICYKEKFVQANGKPVTWLSPKTEVRLWHPLAAQAAEVQSWRRWLEEYEVTQPFKQAHREIYILTDAERETRTYSNRFAAHILRQHQFKALCEQRGWKTGFMGSWDSGDAIPKREIPGWGLRAEFWVGDAGDEYAASGVALHVSTDKVRFLDAEEHEVELANVPAVVLSEIMRDADLFVSVCSVGNDPAWADGGAGRQRDYWQRWAFGDLNATAATRREILQRLLPKLKIAKQCSLEDRFLVVRGNLRTYKVHLGSGNIRMEPDDQYLCIVPDSGAHAMKESDKVFLPFEGDTTLSVILSKAFLLADDSKIKDESILRQINPR